MRYNEEPKQSTEQYQSSTTSPTPELFRSFQTFYEPVDAVPVQNTSYNGESVIQSTARYHNPDMPRYVLHQTVHNIVWQPYFDWETEVAFEVQRFDTQFGERYLAGVQGLPSYDESRLIYGR